MELPPFTNQVKAAARIEACTDPQLQAALRLALTTALVRVKPGPGTLDLDHFLEIIQTIYGQRAALEAIATGKMKELDWEAE
jgi:hypothetical protein